jgi:hypothetical protein
MAGPPRSIVDELLDGPALEATKMQATTKFRVTVLVFAIVGFMLAPQTPLGAVIWGPAVAEGAPPTGTQLGLLLGVEVVQSVAFGLGIAVLTWGLPAFERLFAGRARITQLAVAWGLASWVPHGALHMTAGANLDKLIVIEYAFHVTLVLAGAALAYAVWRTAEERASPAPAAVPRPSATLTMVRRAP